MAQELKVDSGSAGQNAERNVSYMVHGKVLAVVRALSETPCCKSQILPEMPACVLCIK